MKALQRVQKGNAKREETGETENGAACFDSNVRSKTIERARLMTEVIGLIAEHQIDEKALTGCCAREVS